jgi:hypothetical protein
VRAILGQQITVKGATTWPGPGASVRTALCFPEQATVFPRPEDLADADFTNRADQGVAATIRGLARAVVDGKISFEGVVAPEDFLSRICEIPGIGAWTAQYVAMRALGEPDAFPPRPRAAQGLDSPTPPNSRGEGDVASLARLRNHVFVERSIPGNQCGAAGSEGRGGTIRNREPAENLPGTLSRFPCASGT